MTLPDANTHRTAQETLLQHLMKHGSIKEMVSSRKATKKRHKDVTKLKYLLL